MKKPMVTVIIPAYNSQEYIGRCLDSVLLQSFQDFEIIVINDGSKDKTGKIIEKYAKKDKRIRYYEQKNIGVARTRNRAVRLAKGEFIAFIDNDDFIDEDYLDNLLPKFGEDVVISGFKRPNKNGKIITRMDLEDEEWSKYVNPTPWAKIYRKKFITDNDIAFLDNNIGEDIYFNLIGMLVAGKTCIKKYVGYNWFYNEDSVSSTKHKKYNEVDIFKLLNSCYQELKKRGLLEKNCDLIEFFFYRFIVWFLLYAAKGSKKEEIDRIYDELFVWLKERFPNYRKNKLLKGNLPGEIKTTRIIYKTFMVFHKIGSGKLLVWGYAKI